MKQIVVTEFGGPEKLVLHSVPTPSAAEGEIVIKVAAIGVNYADSLQRQNLNIVPTALPYRPGYEVAGTVAKLGKGVVNFSLGDRVVAMLPGSGGYAEYVSSASFLAAPIPAAVSFAESLALQVQGLTAYLMLKHAARLTRGQSVLIHAAAGGVGSLLVQIAKQMGAGKVIAAASNAEKLAIAKSLGADEIINYSQPDWVQQISDITEQNGVDLILTGSGGDLLHNSFRCLANFGKMVIYGHSGGSTTIEHIFSQFAMSNYSIQVFGLAGYFGKPDLMQEAYQYLFSQATAGTLKIHLAKSFSLAQAAEAHTQMENRETTGKIVLVP